MERWEGAFLLDKVGLSMMVLSCELNNVRRSKDGNKLFTHIDLFFYGMQTIQVYREGLTVY